MRRHPTTRTYAVIVGILGCALLAACAAPADNGDVSPPAAGRPVDAVARPTVTVPDLLGRDATTIEKTVSEAGVVLITEHVAAATEKSGTIVNIDPAAGTPVPLGSTITVAVAGPAGATLDDLIAADRRTFVGLGVDPDGTLVVAVGKGADATAALRRLEPALAGRRHRVARCATTYAELGRITAEVSRRTDLRAGGGFGVAVDPAVCAVRVKGAVPAGVAADLRARYGPAVVVEPGDAARRQPRG